VSDLDNQWAWSQVEAMADRSLDASSTRRMRDAMAKDLELTKAVERAAALRSELARLRRVPVPAGQRLRLLSIASGPRASTVGRAPWRMLPIAAAIAAGAAAIGLSALLHRPSPPAPAAEARAVSDFETAMAYLHRSAAVAGTEVTAAIGGSLRDALVVSRNAVQQKNAARQKKQDPKNGG
jgi:hypothetical protein